MSKGMALLVGIKDGGACAGSENDVDNIFSILQPLGYDIRILKTATATTNNILRFLNYAASKLQSGDIFVFYCSSHGGQQPNFNSNDWEPDGQDETLITYDGKIIDDQLNEIWCKIKMGVRVVMISDTCNSGTNYKNTGRDYLADPTPFLPIRSSDSRTPNEIKAQMIHMGGCIDGDSSYPDLNDPSIGGEFTLSLCKTWRNGHFQGGYWNFYEAVCSGIRTSQTPSYNEYGPVSDEFRNQRPFYIGTGALQGIRAKVIAGRINVRNGPGTDYADIGDLYEGDMVNILSIAGSDAWIEFQPGRWAAITYKGSRFMEIISSVEPPDIKAKVVVPRINIRTGPGMDYPDIGDLYESDTVNILCIAGNDAWIEFQPGRWAAITYKGSRFMEIER